MSSPEVLLKRAIIANNESEVRNQLSAGADVNTLFNGRVSPLGSASANGRTEIVRILLEHPEVNTDLGNVEQSISPLKFAFICDHRDIIEMLASDDRVDACIDYPDKQYKTIRDWANTACIDALERGINRRTENAIETLQSLESLPGPISQPPLPWLMTTFVHKEEYIPKSVATGSSPQNDDKPEPTPRCRCTIM